MVVLSKTENLTVQSGAVGKTIDMTQQGYKLLGVVGFKTGNSGYLASEITVGDNSVYFAARNPINTDATGEIIAVLYGLYIALI